MNSVKILMGVLFALLLVFGCADQPPMAPENPASQASPIENQVGIARALIEQTAWPIDETALQEITGPTRLAKGPDMSRVLNLQVQPIARGVVHYKFQVRVGPGAYNMIGIHRVVKEKAPLVPIKTSQVLFYQHGDAKDFEGMLLPGVKGPNLPDDFGLAVYLAEHGIDVWGIDQAWNLVPEGVTNFDFMRNWGLQKNVDDLRLAIAVARTTRLITGCGCEKVVLCGYSSGVGTTVALLNEETQLPASARQVKGYVPVDLGVKHPPSALKDNLAADAQRLRGLFEQGECKYDTGFPPLGLLGQNDPNGDSPIIPGLTNLQAALFFGAGQIFPGETFHYHAGTLDDTGFPVGLRFVTVPEWLDFMASGAWYEPRRKCGSHF